MNPKTTTLILGLLLAGSGIAAQAQQLAFPGAQGWGRFATGGRSGSVYHVTNLNDSGTGSLRDAVSTGNRIVVFDVAGVIKISSRIVFANNLYVAGQTAPGEGITVYGDGVSFSGANNTIVRYMRFRMGHNGSSGKDCAGISNGTNMIFDHCSFAWGLDETFSINPDGKGDLGNITIQNSIVGQGLLTHSAGGLMQADNITLYRNFYCDNSTRNNKVKGVNQYVNNLVYNWKNGAYIMGGDSEGDSYCNIEGNLFINGPAVGGAAFTGGNGNFHFYGNDNWQDSNRDGVFDPKEVTDYSASDRQATPYDYPELEKWAGNTLIDNLLPSVGASLPYRDYTDCYMIDEVMSFGTKGALISNEETLVYGAPSTWKVWTGNGRVDTDGDGMPDDWETANGTDPNKNDAMTKAANGYANIENYINSITKDNSEPYLRVPMCPEVAESQVNALTVAWRDYTEGEDGFALEIKGGAYEDFTELMRTEAGATSATIANLDAATTYTIRIRAFAADGSLSDYTEELTAKTRPVPVEMVDIETYLPDYSWSGGDGVWDAENALVWSENMAYIDNSKVLFDLSSDAVVTLNANVEPAAVVVKGSGQLTVNGEGAITGQTTLNKAGEGTLVLNNVNSYKGATVLHGGVLEMPSLKNGGEPSAIGASDEFAQNWIMDGGTYRYTGGTTSTNRSALIYRQTTLEIADAAANVTMTGTLEGSDNFVLDGKGKLTVATENLFGFDGDLILKGGNLYLSTAAIATAGIGSANRLVMAGGKLSTKGESSGYETYSFPIYVEEGTTSVFAPNRNCYWTSTVSGKGTLQIDIPYLREYIQGNYTNFSGRMIANGVGTDKNGSLFLIADGKNLPNTVVETKGNARVCSWATNGNITLGGLSGASGTYLMGSSKNTRGFTCQWNIGGANTDETFAGIINDWSCSGSSYTGTTSIVKQGTGDWRLTGTNTYSGTTTVQAGRLVVNGKNNGAGSYSVRNGAVLAGKGTIGGSIVVSEGGTIYSGDTVVTGSTLTLAKSLFMSSGSIASIPLTGEKNNSLTLNGKMTIGEDVTLVLAEEGLESAPYNGTTYKLFNIGSTASIEGQFAAVVPATPGEGQQWDLSALYTEGVIKVVGGEDNPIPDDPNPDDPQPGLETKTALLTWGNMSVASYDNSGVNNMLVGVDGDDAEGFSMVVTGNLAKYYSAADKINVEYKGETISRTTIKCSNGAENSIFLPENASVTKVTLWSYTNVTAENRVCYWASVGGVDYTEATATILSPTKNTAQPNCVGFDFKGVKDVLTFRNSGEQQCVIVSLEYNLGGGSQPDGITSASQQNQPVRIDYYTTSGERVSTPTHGLYIMRSTLGNGKTVTTKVVR